MPAWRRGVTRRAARAALATALSLSTAGTLVHAPLAVAQEAPGAPAPAPGDVSALIRAVADATGRLDTARQDIRVKREDVNKTLVDLQVARVDLDRAIRDRDIAAREREKADGDLATATGTLQDYSRMLYRQGAAPGAATELVDPSGPADAGRRQELLQRASADQRDVVGRLEKARGDASDRERKAGEAVGVAQQRHDDASRQRDVAQQMITDVSQQVAELGKQVDDLNRRLDDARKALAANRGPGTTPPPAAAAPAGGTGTGNRDVALRDEAARRVAADPTSQKYASDIANALPSHLDLGAVRDLATGSGDTARKAASGAVDSGSVEQAVTAGAAGDTDAIVQQVVDAVRKADVGSAQAGPAGKPSGGQDSTGPTGGADDESGDESDDENDEGGDEQQPPTRPGSSQGGKPGPTAPSNASVAKKIDTVVDRATSQLGLPYAWGGGDAKGPTKGIRDGGVADSFGDYAKTGFDCSGLMIYAFAGVGIALSHFTGYQYEAGRKVPVAERKRGDMLFWPGHVALYIGDGKMIEAPESGDVVKISDVRMGGIDPYAVRLIE